MSVEKSKIKAQSIQKCFSGSMPRDGCKIIHLVENDIHIYGLKKKATLIRTCRVGYSFHLNLKFPICDSHSSPTSCPCVQKWKMLPLTAIFQTVFFMNSEEANTRFGPFLKTTYVLC